MPLATALLALGLTFPPGPEPKAVAFAVARAVAFDEVSTARRRLPNARFRLLASGGALRPTDLLRLRANLGLPGPMPKAAPDVVTLDFGAVRRLPKGRLGMDASVWYDAQGGFRARYVVNLAHHPDSTLERRTVLLRYGRGEREDDAPRPRAPGMA